MIAVSFFVRAWLIALIALIVGRYVGKSTVRFPAGIGANLKVYLLVWVTTAVAQFAFASIGTQLQLREHIQSGVANFLLPIIVGALAARQLLLQETQKTKI